MAETKPLEARNDNEQGEQGGHQSYANMLTGFITMLADMEAQKAELKAMKVEQAEMKAELKATKVVEAALKTELETLKAMKAEMKVELEATKASEAALKALLEQEPVARNQAITQLRQRLDGTESTEPFNSRKK